MLEKDLALLFKKTFAKFPILHMISKTNPGWPDRLIQLPNSRVCYVELKIVKPTLKGTFRIDLRSDQASWMAKWQYHEGLCFLMFMDKFSHGPGAEIMTLSYGHWKSWLAAPTTDFTCREPVQVFASSDLLLEWFEEFAEI